MSNPIITLPVTIVPAPLTTPDPAPILLTATLVREWLVDLGRGEGPLVESTVSGHYDAASKNDGGGHKFISDREMQGGSNDSWANLWRYVQGAPAPQAYWKVLPPPDSEGVGYKLDFVSMCPNANGSVEIWMNAHQIKSGTRKSCLAFAVVPDAGWVVGPHSDLEDAGAPFDLSALGGITQPPPPAGLSDEDKTWFQGRLDALATAIAARFGAGGDVRTGIQQKVMDGLVALLDPANPDTRAQAFRYLLWKWDNDRIWEEVNKVAEARGLGHPPAGLEDAAPVFDEAAGRAALTKWRRQMADELAGH